MVRITVEHVTVMWNDDTGERFEIGDDRDGLDMTELRWLGSDGKVGQAVAFPAEFLPAVIAALQSRVKEG